MSAFRADAIDQLIRQVRLSQGWFGREMLVRDVGAANSAGGRAGQMEEGLEQFKILAIGASYQSKHSLFDGDFHSDTCPENVVSFLRQTHWRMFAGDYKKKEGDPRWTQPFQFQQILTKTSQEVKQMQSHSRKYDLRSQASKYIAKTAVCNDFNVIIDLPKSGKHSTFVLQTLKLFKFPSLMLIYNEHGKKTTFYHKDHVLLVANFLRMMIQFNVDFYKSAGLSPSSAPQDEGNATRLSLIKVLSWYRTHISTLPSLEYMNIEWFDFFSRSTKDNIAEAVQLERSLESVSVSTVSENEEDENEEAEKEDKRASVGTVTSNLQKVQKILHTFESAPKAQMGAYVAAVITDCRVHKHYPKHRDVKVGAVDVRKVDRNLESRLAEDKINESAFQKQDIFPIVDVKLCCTDQIFLQMQQSFGKFPLEKMLHDALHLKNYKYLCKEMVGSSKWTRRQEHFTLHVDDLGILFDTLKTLPYCELHWHNKGHMDNWISYGHWDLDAQHFVP